ncbi:hypothetical protein OF001_U130066 [Pseudomonas sp. OF001]|nr:hypothetical protein OF001_U130066 [Pseudomonas sp. OF001]
MPRHPEDNAQQLAINLLSFPE